MTPADGHPDQAVVVGAGLTGALLAIRLARRGDDVLLVDRRPDLRVHDVDHGRSINLALSTRGLDALSHIGLDHDVLADAIPMKGRMIHRRDGELAFQPYGTEPHEVLQSVNRDALNRTLLDAAEREPGVRVVFNTRVRDVNLATNQVLIDEAGELEHQRFGTVYGADGAYSSVRLRLQKTGRFDYEQSFLDHGYKELLIPAGADGGYQLEPHALHIWPRGTHMMIALPNPDGSFTGTLFWPWQGATAFDTVTTDAEIHAVFADQFPDVPALIPDLAEQYRHHPDSSLVTVRCGPWFHDDRILVIGDAAHAVVPFYGQGANASMEDVTILFEEFETHGDDRAAAFSSFYEARKPHTDALAELAHDNYLEMRDHVASRWFLLRQALHRWLHRHFADHFVPLYTMVTFTRIPYADALARSRRQDRFVHRLLTGGLVLIAAILGAVVALAIS